MRIRPIHAAVGLLTAVLTVASGGVALAQEARQPVTIDVGKACGVVTLTFVNPQTDVSKTHGFRWNAVAGEESTGDGARTGLVTVGPGKTVKETIRFAEDEFGGVAAVTVAPAFGPDSDIQPRLDVYPVDTDCGVPTTTPPPDDEDPPAVGEICAATSIEAVDGLLRGVVDSELVGALAPLLDITVPRGTDSVEVDAAVDLGELRQALDCDETPAPTTPPATTPPPADDDIDCGEVTDERAQEILDADETDPHGLDVDNDGVACEDEVDLGDDDEFPSTPPETGGL